jgi:hypothetical protein
MRRVPQTRRYRISRDAQALNRSAVIGGEAIEPGRRFLETKSTGKALPSQGIRATENIKEAPRVSK